jgi:hypothetical protein
VVGVVGSIVRLVTVCLVKPVAAAFQLLPPSMLLNTRPPYDPAYRVVGVAGSIASATIIPPSGPMPAQTSISVVTLPGCDVRVGVFSIVGDGVAVGATRVAVDKGVGVREFLAVGSFSGVAVSVAVVVAVTVAVGKGVRALVVIIIGVETA